MADYPHASAACLCYLDGREGGEEREKQRCCTFKVLFALLDCPHCSAGHLKLARERKRTRGRREERVSGPKSAVEEPDCSLTLQSAVWSKLLWTASFRGEGLSLRGWQLHGDKVQLALVGVGERGGPDQSWTIVMVLFRGKSLFVPGLFKPTPGSSQGKWDF